MATGSSALRRSTTGHDNLAIGFHALFANTTGTSNVAVGSGAGASLTTGSNNVDIANAGVAGESAAIRIGTNGTQKRAFLAGVSGRSIPGPAQPVLVNGKGQLGTASSRSDASPKLLSAAAGRRLLDEVRRQRRQIRRLRQRVFGSG